MYREILNLLLILCTYPYDQWSMHSMVCLLLQISLYLFFYKFKTNMLAENHLIIRAKTRFADVGESINFLLEFITLVSSTNNIGSAKEFIRNGRSFI